MRVALDEVERVHLFRLAGAEPPPPPRAPGSVAVAPEVRAFLDTLVPHPAFVIDRCFDIVAWNAAEAALAHGVDLDRPRSELNVLWLMFTEPSLRALFGEFWAAHDVHSFRSSVRRLHHPLVGRLDLTYVRLSMTTTRDAASSRTFPRPVPTARNGCAGCSAEHRPFTGASPGPRGPAVRRTVVLGTRETAYPVNRPAPKGS
ncbi:MmyB family transcriptional regulator [Actinacidiphila alni]|uniref:MmyB family transcriptional regulator n=1 Tax=Actinacidiphila alni TaxID=380248 RepID=UPI00345528EA